MSILVKSSGDGHTEFNLQKLVVSDLQYSIEDVSL